MRPAEIVDEMKRRAKALRLSNKEWAQACGLDETTLGRTLNGDTNPLISTLERMEEALAADERRVRRHLDALERSRNGRQLDMLETRVGA
jgi:predicted transcriptional regulator